MKARILTVVPLFLFLVGALVAPANAGPIEDAVAGIEDGRVRFSYPTREGVHGGSNHDGVHISIHRDDDHDGGWGWSDSCNEGPGRAQLRIRKGELVDLNTAVGGEWRSTRDDEVQLGMLDAAVAMEFFLHLAETGRGEPAEDAVFAAAIADVEMPWERFLALARDRSRPEDIRESAIFWLGVGAGEKATEGISSLARDNSEDMQIREHAVFSLSQIDGPEALEKLMEIARSHGDPEIREKALFWLAQRDEDEVLDLFEEILLGS
jgi:hypothetical protein